MKGFKIFRTVMPVAALAMLMISGCSDDGGSMVPARTAVTITADNAAAVASDALNAAAFSLELGGLGGGVLAPAPSDDGLSKLAGRPPVTAALVKLLGQSWQVPVGPVTVPCATTGFMTLSGNIADPVTLSAGDALRAVFDDCDDGDGVVLNGQLDLAVNNVVGDLLLDPEFGLTGAFELSMTVTLTNLSADDGGDVPTVNGAMSLVLDTRGFPQFSTRVSGDRLAMSSALRSLTVEHFVSTLLEDLGVSSYTMTATGRVSGSRYEGYADYQTQEPFVGVPGDNPQQGEMLIRGANNSSIRLLAIDALSVRLEIDINGDGAADETRTLSWDEAVS